MSALAGQIADPQQYNDDTRKRLARGRRTTDSAVATNTEVSVLRLDGLYLKAGRNYQFHTGSMLALTSVANDIVAVRLRYDSGDTATTSSSEAGYTQSRRASTSSEMVLISADYTPTVDEVGSLLLTVARASGTGNCQLGAGTTYPICLYVDDRGVDPGDTGIDL